MSVLDPSEVLPLGTKTDFGEVAAISFIGGERYYFLIDHEKTVTMLPQVYFDLSPPNNLTKGSV